MKVLLIALTCISMAFLPAKQTTVPAGTEIVLQPYTTESFPLVPYDQYQAAHVNEHWIVIETLMIQYNGVNYPLLRLQNRFGTQGLEWSGNQGAFTLAAPHL